MQGRPVYADLNNMCLTLVRDVLCIQTAAADGSSGNDVTAVSLVETPKQNKACEVTFVGGWKTVTADSEQKDCLSMSA